MMLPTNPSISGEAPSGALLSCCCKSLQTAGVPPFVSLKVLRWGSGASERAWGNSLPQHGIVKIVHGGVGPCSSALLRQCSEQRGKLCLRWRVGAGWLLCNSISPRRALCQAAQHCAEIQRLACVSCKLPTLRRRCFGCLWPCRSSCIVKHTVTACTIAASMRTEPTSDKLRM